MPNEDLLPTDVALPKAPPAKASVEDHKKHAEDFLALDEFKVKPDGYPDVEFETEEAIP